MFTRTCRLLLTATCLLVGWGPFAQAQTGAGRAFEVASIKPSARDARGTKIVRPPGRLEIGNMTLKEMIVNAYSVQPFQVSGGGGWVDSVHYDISAKAGARVSREDVLLMLQALLADRFRLAFRRETRQLPVFALVLARKDGKLGPRLIPSREGACTPFDPAKPFAVDNMRLCGAFSLGPDGLTLVSGSIASLSPRLSRLLGRMVIDKTGLTRNFDINIEWSPDETLAMQPADRGRGDNISPSIFTVFRQDLGLDFKAENGPVDILVIQRAEMPSGN
ncbi:MAG TPA: TIGR03435 family protein [Bryobacteraceae bacterium]|nr:TIGR03435 family protein [Bryobacteraceae bacterium]